MDMGGGAKLVAGRLIRIILLTGLVWLVILCGKWWNEKHPFPVKVIRNVASSATPHQDSANPRSPFLNHEVLDGLICPRTIQQRRVTFFEVPNWHHKRGLEG